MKIEVTPSNISRLRALLDRISGKQTKLSDPLPLNPAAVAEQKRHADAVDDLAPRIRAAERAMRNIKEELEDEQERWSCTMRKVMPELDNNDFQISEDGTQYMLVTEEPETPKPPEWVDALVEQIKAGKVPTHDADC